MLILRWLINALALYLVSLLPGELVRFVDDRVSVILLTALVLGLVNAIIRPLLLILTLPINLLTLGLFTFVINAAMLMLTAQLISGFQVDSFGKAVLASIVLMVISFWTNMALVGAKASSKLP
jgi:putative membrane protein